MPSRKLAGTNRVPVRNESFFRVPMKDGTIRTVIVRDALAVEDPYLKLARAYILTVLTGDEFGADLTSRVLKDDLIKANIEI